VDCDGCGYIGVAYCYSLVYFLPLAESIDNHFCRVIVAAVDSVHALVGLGELWGGGVMGVAMGVAYHANEDVSDTALTRPVYQT